MNRTKYYLLYLLAGALAYWVPDIAIHWIQASRILSIFLLTIIPPGMVGVSWYLLWRHRDHVRFRVSLSLLMLLGIWIAGPPAIAFGMMPVRGSFWAADRMDVFYSIWARFPIATPMMADRFGSLASVCSVSIALVVAAIIAGGTSERSQNSHLPLTNEDYVVRQIRKEKNYASINLVLGGALLFIFAIVVPGCVGILGTIATFGAHSPSVAMGAVTKELWWAWTVILFSSIFGCGVYLRIRAHRDKTTNLALSVDMSKCPFCDASIKEHGVVCATCGRILSTSVPNSVGATIAPKQ